MRSRSLLACLFFAGGLMDSSPEDVLLYDLDTDGAVTVRDAVAILRACPRVTLPRTYFVSNGSQSADDVLHGSETAPWRTLSYALPRLFAGDTLNVRGGPVVNPGGDYVETVQPKLQPGTASDRITVQAHTGEYPTLKGLLRLNKPDYWTFDRLNVTWPLGDPGAVSTAHMLKIHGGTGWIYQNSEIWGAKSYAGMLVGHTATAGYPSNWTVQYNVIHDTNASNASNQDHLLYINTGLEAGPGLIERNILYNATNGNGIKLGPDESLGGSANVIVQYNTIYNTVQSIMVANDSHDNTLYRNLLVTTGTHTGGSRYYCIRGYQLDGEDNTAHHNAGYDARGMFENDAGYVGVDNVEGNVFPLDPWFDSIGPTGFHPGNPSATQYGRYAP